VDARMKTRRAVVVPEADNETLTRRWGARGWVGYLTRAGSAWLTGTATTRLSGAEAGSWWRRGAAQARPAPPSEVPIATLAHGALALAQL
jgi:hypothetical protein